MELPAFSRRTLENSALAAIIILVGTACFGLGRLSATGHARVPAYVVPAETSGSAASAALGASRPVSSGSGAGEVAASKNGAKYYPAGCAGAARISEANKVTFASPEEAEAAGYEKAAACK